MLLLVAVSVRRSWVGFVRPECTHCRQAVAGPPPCPESHTCLGPGSCWGQPRHVQRVTLASARAPVGDSHAMSRESGLPRLDSHVQLKAVALQQYSCLLPLNQVTQFLLCIWQRVTDVTSSAPALEGHILKIIIKKTFKHSTEPRE